jgi:glutamate-1-semialdehyde 2,1-aminomutase
MAAGLAALDAQRPVTVNSVTGLVTPFFSVGPVTDFAGAGASDGEAYAAFCRGLLDRGVYPPPSRFEAWFVSLAHDKEAIDVTLQAAADALSDPASGAPRAPR